MLSTAPETNRQPPQPANGGFTLIELSIVLVIIGLIVGGILVGQDLIKNAEVRAQISQIEKYNQAVNTFRGKFGGLPGDLAMSASNFFGFGSNSGCDGSTAKRDGNGLIDGCSPWLVEQGLGETELFWSDLSSAVAGSLVDGQFPNSGAAAITCNWGNGISVNTTPGTSFIGDYLPQGKIGHGTFVYVYENSGYNWFGLSAGTSINTGGELISSGTIPVFQAYNIDKKVDDGLPTTGAVVAFYLNNNAFTPPNISQSTSGAADTTTTCYNTTNNAYSTSSVANYGAGGNCALSFRFQ